MNNLLVKSNPVRVSQVVDSFESLSQAVSMLEESSIKLFDRLNRVLRSEPVCPEKEVVKQTEYSTPLALDIQSIKDKIVTVNKRLNQANDLIEL